MRLLAVIPLLALCAQPLEAQTGRAALGAGTERYLLADYQEAVPLLSLGLDPTAGPLDELWLRGVERLADVWLVLRQDSLAATWLRWAIRLAPQFEVDPETMPPVVIRAARGARAFVDSTPQDRFAASLAFEWPTRYRTGAGAVRLAAADIPITARIGRDQFLRGGESRALPPGSYPIVVSAPGYLPTRLTVEVLPGITTLVRVSLLPETAGTLYVAARPWGDVWLDSQRIGYTAIAGHRISPGSHRLRVVRPQGHTVDTTITVGDRQAVRLAWMTRPERSGDAALDSALALLDAAESDRGAQALQRWLVLAPSAVRRPGQALALVRLAETMWALGVRDSARGFLRTLVETEPFYRPPTELFSPELREVYDGVRQSTPVIALRAPADTVLQPVSEALPIELAVGQPGEVRLLLRFTAPGPRDSLLTTLRVDSVATARVPLTGPNGGVMTPGSYALEGELTVGGTSVSDLLQLTIERLPLDTLTHEPPPSTTELRPEIKKGIPSLPAMAEALGLGLLGVTLTALASDGELSGGNVPVGSLLVGISITVGHLTGGAPRVVIRENREHNATLRARWEERNREIQAENARRVRSTPVRIRTGRAP